MGPKPSQSQTGELFGYPLRDHLTLKHPLILLGDRIQWARIDALALGLTGRKHPSGSGRPGQPPDTDQHGHIQRQGPHRTGRCCPYRRQPAGYLHASTGRSRHGRGRRTIGAINERHQTGASPGPGHHPCTDPGPKRHSGRQALAQYTGVALFGQLLCRP